MKYFITKISTRYSVNAGKMHFYHQKMKKSQILFCVCITYRDGKITLIRTLRGIYTCEKCINIQIRNGTHK